MNPPSRRSQISFSPSQVDYLRGKTRHNSPVVLSWRCRTSGILRLWIVSSDHFERQDAEIQRYPIFETTFKGCERLRRCRMKGKVIAVCSVAYVSDGRRSFRVQTTRRDRDWRWLVPRERGPLHLNMPVLRRCQDSDRVDRGCLMVLERIDFLHGPCIITPARGSGGWGMSWYQRRCFSRKSLWCQQAT